MVKKAQTFTASERVRFPKVQHTLEVQSKVIFSKLQDKMVIAIAGTMAKIKGKRK